MRTMMMMVFMPLCLSFGCATDESGSRADEAAAEGVGQVKQQVIGATCGSNCDCDLGEFCNAQKCQTFFVISPTSGCTADCQCQKFYGLAYHCNFNRGSYGDCVM